MTNAKERAGAVLKIVARSAGAGIKSFVLTTLAMGALTGLLLACSIAITYAAGRAAMLLVALLVLAGSAAVWWIVATKRAISGALNTAVQQSELGRHSMELILDRLLHVHAEDEHGERGRRPAEVAERLPLQKAEERLTAAVDSVLADRSAQTDVRGWLARKIRAASLRLVHRITLEELRDEDAQHGGVDLIQVQDKLAKKVDKKLIKLIQKTARKVTRLAVAALLIVSLAGSVALRVLLLP